MLELVQVVVRHVLCEGCPQMHFLVHRWPSAIHGDDIVALRWDRHRVYIVIDGVVACDALCEQHLLLLLLLLLFLPLLLLALVLLVRLLRRLPLLLLLLHPHDLLLEDLVEAVLVGDVHGVQEWRREQRGLLGLPLVEALLLLFLSGVPLGS